jgi:hypothetical protein
MKKLLSVTCCILLSISLFGQDSVMTVSQNKFVHVDFGVGYLRTDLSSINRSLTDFGYMPINENFVTFSISSGFFINRFLLRNEVSILFPNSMRQYGDVTTTFSGYSLMAGVGYAVIAKPKFRLYPFANAIAYINRLNFEDNATIENMNGVVNTPHHSSTLVFSNASFDVGLQIEKVIDLKHKKWDCPQNGKFTTVGVRFGYMFGPGPVKGRYNGNQTIADAPTYSLNGPYIKVIWGLGTKIRDIKWKSK